MSMLEAYAAQPQSVPGREQIRGVAAKRSSKFSMVMNVRLTRSIRTSALHWTDLKQPIFSTADLAEAQFKGQKKAFESIPPLLLEEHRGKYVVSRNGEIKDSDADLATLMKRFFNRNGDVPVYIEKIGEENHTISIDTPFLD